MWFNTWQFFTNRTNIQILTTGVIIWKIWILGIVLLATFILPQRFNFTARSAYFGETAPYPIWVWGNFDGVHYMKIAQKGYEPLTQPFFPFFPWLMQVVHTFLPIDWIWIALFVSHLVFLGTLPGLWYLLKRDTPTASWWLFCFLLLIYPTSAFYGAAYNDSLFFFWATWCIVCARRKLWFWAGIAGGCATLTRLNGLALFWFLVIEATYGDWNFSTLSDWWKKTKSRLYNWSQLPVAAFGWSTLIPAAFFGYLTYIQWNFGDWRYLFSTMEIWAQSTVTFPPIVIWRYLKIILSVSPLLIEYWVAVLELGIVFWYCYLLAWSLFKLRLSYWVFFALSILIPWLTGTFAGMPRYALHIYPLFLATLGWYTTQSRQTKLGFIFLNLLLGVFIISLFTRGYFVT